jgi:hypothetical protein
MSVPTFLDRQPCELHILILSSNPHPPHKLYYACNIESKCYLRPKNSPKKVFKLHDEDVETQSSSINYTWQYKNQLWVNNVCDKYKTIVRIVKNMGLAKIATTKQK